MLRIATLTVLTIALAVSAHAQQPTRLRGTIASVTGSDIEITLRDGSKASATLSPKLTVASVGIAQIADIKPDSYIGTAAVTQPDGTLRALEVHVFAASMRGAGEGHRPWDSPGPTNTMTNGAVASVTGGNITGSSGRTLHVTYQGGAKDISCRKMCPSSASNPAHETS